MVLDMSPAKSNEVHRTKSIDLERAANGSLRRSRDESSESERLLSIRTIISGSNLKSKERKGTNITATYALGLFV